MGELDEHEKKGQNLCPCSFSLCSSEAVACEALLTFPYEEVSFLPVSLFIFPLFTKTVLQSKDYSYLPEPSNRVNQNASKDFPQFSLRFHRILKRYC